MDVNRNRNKKEETRNVSIRYVFKSRRLDAGSLIKRKQKERE